MLAEKMTTLSWYGNRRSVGLLLATASFVFVVLSYLSISQPHRDAILAAAGKASPLQSHPLSHPQHQATSSSPSTPPPPPPPPPPAKKHSTVFEAASNSTVGFEKIVFLNLPHRHDRFDAAAVQSHLSRVRLTRFPAVDAKLLQVQGMPPTEKPERLSDGEKGCWRAHANVWQHMLEEDIPGVMVLESDAAWDVNLRPIMGRLNGAFRELLAKENPTETLADDPDDPWLARSGLWDLLSVGHCVDNRNHEDNYVVYDDPHAPHTDFALDGIDETLNRKRVVYRSTGVVCTTGYLVSQSGAAKMLVRTMWNLEEPVDLIIAMMASAGELKVYSQKQNIIAQWTYISDIGKGGANSDIRNQGDNKVADGGTPEGWDRARDHHSSWEVVGMYQDSDFVDFALGNAWKHLIDEKKD